MTREEFLNRCGTAFDAGLIRPETLTLLDRWTDLVLRLEGGQVSHVAEILSDERRRTDNFLNSRTLANDADGYDLIRLAAILNHHCQTCATDKEAWWTRGGFCDHAKHRCKQGVTPWSTK